MWGVAAGATLLSFSLWAFENPSAGTLPWATISIAPFAVSTTSTGPVAAGFAAASGFGAEIAAQIADKAFEYLDAPIKRVAAADSPVPYNWFLEEEVLPQTSWIVEAIKQLIKF